MSSVSPGLSYKMVSYKMMKCHCQHCRWLEIARTNGPSFSSLWNYTRTWKCFLLLYECYEIMESNISFNSTSELVNYSLNSTATHCSFEPSIGLGFHIVYCVIGTIGILSNGITIVVVCKEKRLNTLTYVSILCLALADFVYVSSKLPRDNLLFWYCQLNEFRFNFMRVCDFSKRIGPLIVHSTRNFTVIFAFFFSWFILWKVTFALQSQK